MSFHAWSTKIDLGILGEVAGIVEGEIIGTDECMTTKILKVSIFNGKGWLDITKRISKREMDGLSANFEDEFRQAHCDGLSWTGRDTRFA